MRTVEKWLAGGLLLLLVAGVIGWVRQCSTSQMLEDQRAVNDSLRAVEDSLEIEAMRARHKRLVFEDSLSELKERVEERIQSARARIARLASEADSLEGMVLASVPDSLAPSVEALIARKDSIITEQEVVISEQDSVIRAQETNADLLHGEITSLNSLLSTKNDRIAELEKQRKELTVKLRSEQAFFKLADLPKNLGTLSVGIVIGWVASG